MKKAFKWILRCGCGALAVIGIFAIIGAVNGNQSFINAFDKQQEQQVDNDLTNDDTNDETQEDENQSEYENQFEDGTEA